MLSALRYALLPPIRPLVRFYLKKQNQKHMEYSYRFLTEENPDQAKRHCQIAETFRIARDALRRDKTIAFSIRHRTTVLILAAPHGGAGAISREPVE